MIKRCVEILYFLLIFSFILQTGKHYWPSFSFISGIRVDYLSPTLYLSDVIVGMLIPGFIFGYWLEIQRDLRYFFSHRLWILLGVVFVYTLFISTVNAYQPLIALYGLIKLLGAVCVGYMTTVILRDKANIIWVFKVIVFAGGIASIIGIFQFLIQQSIGSWLYVLGERSFTAYTPGIARFVLEDNVLLRPYATFPHPNVFAFFLYTTLVVAIIVLVKYSRSVSSRYVIPILALITIALFLTFSRIVILSTVVTFAPVLFYLASKYLQRRYTVVIISVGLLLLFGTYFGTRLFDVDDLVRDLQWRNELIDITFEIVRSQAGQGVGILNFFYHEAFLQRYYSPIFLQPVHNVYLLILTEVGILGFFVVVVCVTSLVYRVWNQFRRYPKKRLIYGILLSASLTVIAVGMFDHYLMTLQQGRLVGAFLLGFIINHISDY